jgi:catechol 2,3-dioxygenase-like lactoylglutathione lyase family enzyme
MNVLNTFSGISVSDLAQAKEFYTKTLGLELKNEEMGLQIDLPGGAQLFVYEKSDHQPATFTVLNFVVENIDTTIDELAGKGIKFDHYDLGGGAETDEKGVLRGLAANMGPDIAWFKDPAGNVLSVIQDS